MSLNKRTRRVPNGARTLKEFPRITLDQALDFAINAKRVEGLRDRTLVDYGKHYGYFIKWLRDKYPEVEFAGDITTAMVRDHISFMKYDQVRYEGHKYISEDRMKSAYRIQRSISVCERLKRYLINLSGTSYSKSIRLRR